MKLLTFAATNHKKSINQQLINYSCNIITEFAPKIEIETLNLNDYEMPIYSQELQEASGINSLAQEFYNKIGASDALLISFAEHNGLMTTAWKNIFDWMSRIDIKVWQNKPTVILSAAPGPRSGKGVLDYHETAAPFFGMNLVARYGVGRWADAWNGKSLVQQKDVAGINTALKKLIKYL